MKVAKSNNIEGQIVYGGALGKHVVRIFERFVPKLKHTKGRKEGLMQLYKELEKELVAMGIGKSEDMGYKILEEIRRNTKVEYSNNRVCVTYRNFKKCMELDKK